MTSSAFADAAFQSWLQSLWPQAQARGVSRATFDLATRGLEPDLSLPDLVLPGRPIRIARGATLPRYWFADQLVSIGRREDFVRDLRREKLLEPA